MAATARGHCRKSRAFYYPYVEPTRRAWPWPAAASFAAACIVITDHYPAFFIPGLLAAAARVSAVRVEAVDSNGLIPLATHGRAFTSARSFRAFVQRELRPHLRRDSWRGTRSGGLPRRQAQSTAGSCGDGRPPRAARADCDTRAIANATTPSVLLTRVAASGRLAGASRAFVKSQLGRYGTERNDPDADCTSRLSPYLHFGHISAHEVFSAVMTAERWTTRRLAVRGGGAREGWWGVAAVPRRFSISSRCGASSPSTAANGCRTTSAYESLPGWARDTIAAHTRGARRHLYTFDTLDAASTARSGLERRTTAAGNRKAGFTAICACCGGRRSSSGRPTAPTALAWMEALMNRYSLDGRDPVSYAGFAWVLGRYDRPWPRRPIFGTLRYMSSQSARRKLRMKKFLRSPLPPEGGSLR